MTRLRYACCNGWECDCRGQLADDIDDDYTDPCEPGDYDYDRAAAQYERYITSVGDR